MLNRKMMQSWTLCWIIKLTTSSSKHHLELQAKMWIARPCLVLGDPAPATVRRPSTKSIFEKSASFWESSCGFQTFICLHRIHLCCQSHEKVYTFSPDWGNENGFHRSWFGFGCCSSQFTVTKSWTVLVWIWSVLCLNHIIVIFKNKDTCLKGAKGWCLTEGRIR